MLKHSNQNYPTQRNDTTHNPILQYMIDKLGRDQVGYLLWMAGSILWVAGFIFPNEHNVDIIASNLCRAGGMVVLNGIWAYNAQILGTKTRINNEIMCPKSSDYMSCRHAILSIYGYAFAQAQFYLPAPIIYTIYFSGPLFVILIQRFVFHVKISQNQSKGVILASIGVLLTANGIAITKYLFGSQSQFTTKFENYKTDDVFVKTLVAIGLIIMTFGWAVAIVLVRKISNKNVHHSVANINFGMVLSVLTGMAYQIFKPQTIFTHHWTLYLQCFIFQGIVLAFCQAFFMGALLISENSGTMTMVGFIGVVFSYFVSVLRYGQSINFLCLIGAGLVIVGIYRIVMKEKN